MTPQATDVPARQSDWTPQIPTRSVAVPSLSALKASKKRGLNPRLLVATLILMFFALLFTILLYRRQHARIADSLLLRSEALKESRQFWNSADYINRYLHLRRDDAYATIDLAQVFDKSVRSNGAKHRAVQLYYQAIGAAMSSEDASLHAVEMRLRCRLAELLLDLGQSDLDYYPMAIEQAGYLPDLRSPGNREPSEATAEGFDAKGIAKELSARGWQVNSFARYQLFRAKSDYVLAPSLKYPPGTIGYRGEELSLEESFQEALALNPVSIPLSMLLANEIYRNQDAASRLIAKDSLAEGKLKRRADGVIDAMTAAARTRLVQFLREGCGLLPASAQTSSAHAEQAVAESALAALVSAAHRQLNSDSFRMPESGAAVVGDWLIASLQADKLPGLKRQLVEQKLVFAASLTNRSLGTPTESRLPWIVADADKLEVCQWVQAHAAEIARQGLQERLLELNRDYVTSLIARYAYRLEYGLAGDQEDLANALQLAPENIVVAVVAAQDCERKAAQALERGDKAAVTRHSQKAVEQYQQILQLDPEQERIALALGELYLRQPELAPNDGSGIVGELGDQGVLIGSQPLRVLIDGFGNDFLIASRRSASDAPPTKVRTVQQTSRGDQARIQFDAANNSLTIDIDPAYTRARTVVAAFEKQQLFSANLDNRYDKAIAIWQAARRRFRRSTVAIDLRLAEVYLACGKTLQADALIAGLNKRQWGDESTANGIDRFALRRKLAQLRAESAFEKNDFETCVALLEPLAIEDAEGQQATLPILRLLGQSYAALDNWEKAALRFERAANISPSLAELRTSAADAWVRAENYSRAVRQYERSLAIQENSAVRQVLTKTREKLQEHTAIDSLH